MSILLSQMVFFYGGKTARDEDKSSEGRHRRMGTLGQVLIKGSSGLSESAESKHASPKQWHLEDASPDPSFLTPTPSLCDVIDLWAAVACNAPRRPSSTASKSRRTLPGSKSYSEGFPDRRNDDTSLEVVLSRQIGLFYIKPIIGMERSSWQCSITGLV